MSDTLKTILVPWDFTEVAEFALMHAINFAKKTCDDITLLHIVDKGGLLKNNSKKVQETIAITNKLNKLSCEYTEKYAVKIHAIVIEGSIFTTIGDVASQFNIRIVIMGTHGMKGLQKVTGSWAMKVISGSHLPFLVVQAPPANDEISNIIFPVDISKEMVEKLTWAKFMNKIYKSNIRIIKQYYPGTQVFSNLTAVKKYLTKQEVPFDVYEPVKKKDFTDTLLSYSNRIKADAILIMIQKDLNITDYIMGVEEQSLIFNKHKIPVICINRNNKA